MELDYCEIHPNRKMSPSNKPGGKPYCYDCWKAYKEEKGDWKPAGAVAKSGAGNEDILKALREIWVKLDKIEKAVIIQE